MFVTVLLSLTQAEWDARTEPIGSRQLGFNESTGELRRGPGLWHQCVPVAYRANTEVVAATTGNITIASGLNAGDTIDGVTLADGDLVLVKDQSTASQNGVYVAGASPARATAYDTFAEHVGKLVRVKGGTTNANTHWRCNVVSGGTLNSTAIGFDNEPIGNLNLANGAVLDQLPKREGASVDANCMLLLMDPTTNQLCTISLSELEIYLAS